MPNQRGEYSGLLLSYHIPSDALGHSDQVMVQTTPSYRQIEASFSPHRRWLGETCSHSRTCTPVHHKDCGWSLPPRSQSLWDSPLWQAAVHQDLFFSRYFDTQTNKQTHTHTRTAVKKMLPPWFLIFLHVLLQLNASDHRTHLNMSQR